MLGLYVPGRSVVHRVPAGPKLLGLLVAVTGLVLLREPWAVGVALLVVVGLYAVARIPVRTAIGQLGPLLWVLPVVVVFQVLVAGWAKAAVVSGVLTGSVALAGLLTLTTPVTAILDVCVRLLRPFRRWVDPDRVGLALALTVRLVPVLGGIVREAWEARTARGVTGLRGSVTAVAAPALVRALRTADGLGEALRARGVDD